MVSANVVWCDGSMNRTVHTEQPHGIFDLLFGQLDVYRQYNYSDIHVGDRKHEVSIPLYRDSVSGHSL